MRPSTWVELRRSRAAAPGDRRALRLAASIANTLARDVYARRSAPSYPVDVAETALLLRARRVHSMAPGGADCDTLAIVGARVEAVGSWPTLRARYPEAPTRSLADRVIVPGLIDAHHHLSTAAVTATGVDCHLASARSVAELCARISAYASTLPPGAWVLAREHLGPGCSRADTTPRSCWIGGPRCARSSTR